MRHLCRAFLPVAGALLIGLPGPAPAAETEPPAIVTNTRDTLARWVETEQLIAREKEQWQQGRELLGQRISLLESEISTLREKLADSRQGLADVEGRRLDLFDEKQELEQASAVLHEAIADFEARTGALVGRLPGPLKDRVRPLADRLPEEPTSTRLSLSERFQNVIGVLNEVNKFQSDVHAVSELLELPDGSTAEVRALYLGLAQAWYVTADGTAAGIGRPGADGWVWTADDELAPQVERALEILQNEGVPAYVPLPVEIR